MFRYAGFMAISKSLISAISLKYVSLGISVQWIWMDVKKIIDTLHIANHNDKICHDLYSPELLKKENPDMNTMCCELTLILRGYRVTKGSFHLCPKCTIIFICIEWSGKGTIT